MITTQKKKWIFGIVTILFAIYCIFIYRPVGTGFLDTFLFLLVIFSGFFLADDYYKYTSKAAYHKTIVITLVLALGLYIAAILTHHPANEAKDIITEAIARGLIVGLVVFGVSNYKARLDEEKYSK